MDAFDPYEQVAAEIDAGKLDKPLFVRSFAENSGDDAKAKAAYIKYRAQKLYAMHRQEILEAQRHEQLRVDRERKEAADRSEKERKQAAARRQEDAARAVAAHWRIANEEREAKWRAEAERQRWRAEYWTGTRRAIAWAWSLAVVGGVLWLASGLGTSSQPPIGPIPTAIPTATVDVSSSPATPTPAATVTPLTTVAATPASALAKVPLMVRMGTPPLLPTATPFDVYRAGLERSVRQFLKLRSQAQVAAEQGCFAYPVQIGVSPRFHPVTVTREEMIGRLFAVRKETGLCQYTLVGKLVAYPMTASNAGLWRVSFKSRRQQQSSPYTAATRDYELIMRPQVEQLEPWFRITAIEETESE